MIASLKALGEGYDVDEKWVKECANDLVEKSGKSIVMAGDHLPKEVHATVFAINEALKAPISYVEVPKVEDGIARAVEQLNTGNVETLFVLGGNPVYNAPTDLDWSAAQAKAANSVYFGYAANETSKASSVFIAQSHYLESWGDSRTFDGTLLPVQPMIEPLLRPLMSSKFCRY